MVTWTQINESLVRNYKGTLPVSSPKQDGSQLRRHDGDKKGAAKKFIHQIKHRKARATYEKMELLFEYQGRKKLSSLNYQSGLIAEVQHIAARTRQGAWSGPNFIGDI